jgi:transmembrane sensor
MALKRIEYLVGLFFDNTITTIEKEELAASVDRLSDQQLKQLLESAWWAQAADTPLPADISGKIIGLVTRADGPKEPAETAVVIRRSFHSTTTWKWPAAACLLFPILAVVFWPAGSKPKVPVSITARQVAPAGDVLPGSRKALLVLADGSQILLDSASSGVLAQQGKVQINKLSNGEIVYTNNGDATGELLYNTMSTPTGGIYQLVLPDETKVWLNSASSIRYPIAFGPGERRVSITGEAYFEVAKNALSPFIVTINNNAEVRVLGTHFNVNAYTDESTINTTLLEGAVQVTKGATSTSLTPGQQAQIDQQGGIKRLRGVDLEETLAWKNGNFLFNSAGLPQVLRQAARWYSLEVAYEGKVPEDKFSGQISRSANLSSLLKWMQWSDVHFTLQGRKLIIKG